MSNISPEPLTLQGGCDCASVRYKISLPALSDRAIVLPSSKNNNQGDVRAPKIFFDHCNKCRTVSGAIVQAWLICPQDWITWSISNVSPSTSKDEDMKYRSFSNKEIIWNPELSTSSVVNYNSSPGVVRSFCGRCGTNLMYLYEGRESQSKGLPMVDIVLGSLDKESLEVEGVRPDRHFYWEDGVNWVKEVMTQGDVILNGEKLPRHPGGSRSELV